MGEYAEDHIEYLLNHDENYYQFKNILFKDVISIKEYTILDETVKSLKILVKDGNVYWVSRKFSKLVEINHIEYLFIETWYANKIFN